ncbi:hypothetical protein NIES2109_13630 [Nostoc sp. HK-01]|nr:hypothetical protein NIES2109_13630 [Nostoc sp. HK-01]
MMPVVRIPDPIYKRLQAIAVPFEDTPVTVIEKLLDEYEARQQLQKMPQAEDCETENVISVNLAAENYHILNPDSPDHLHHTRVLQAYLNNQQIKKPNWNKIVDKVHELAIHQGMSVDELIKVTLCRIVQGEKHDSGFHYLPDVNISVQGVDANLAWRNTFHLLKTLKIPVEIYFEWRNKEGAAYPGEKGKLIWSHQ